MKSKKIISLSVGSILTLLGFVYFLNASRLAPTPTGDPTIFSHRGVHQQFSREYLEPDDCTATRIFPPSHDYLENTLRSMAASFEYGADIIELDIHPTTDGEFVVFHDWTLECRTNGFGVTRSRDLAYLKGLDIGYGYTADGGATFPFRGKGVGMMPTLEEVYRAFPDKQFLINVKSNRAQEVDRLYTYIQERELVDSLESLMIYGGENAVARVHAISPEIFAPSRAQAQRCAKRYMLIGWTSYIPHSCKNSAIPIPANKTWMLWGWPNRFIERMNRADTYILLLGDQTETGINGISRIEEIEDIPKNFNGGIFVEAIETLGPYIEENFGGSSN